MFLFLFIYLLILTMPCGMGVFFSQPWMNPCSQYWECGVLATEPPRESLHYVLKNDPPISFVVGIFRLFTFQVIKN